jgi:hypothetical protein
MCQVSVTNKSSKIVIGCGGDVTEILLEVIFFKEAIRNIEKG